MHTYTRLPVIFLTITFSLFPIALSAQDNPPMGGGAASPAITAGVPLQSDISYNEIISPDQTISMDLQEANLRDVLKIFSIQSGLNFISSEAVENKKITLYLDKVPIKLAMDKLFDTNKLTYEFDEDAGIFVVRGKEEDVDMITEIFKLKNRSLLSSNIEKQRTGLFTGSLTSSSGQTGGTAVAEISDIKTTVQQMLSTVGKVTEDNKTNSLIVTDVPNRFPQIRSIIASLDVPQAQVMLDVEMLDVSKDLVDKLGFNFEDNPLMRLSLDMGSKGIAFPFTSSSAKDKLNGLSRSAGLLDFGDSTLGSAFGVTLDMIKQSHDVKLLARPRILTLDHETAEIGITKDEIVSKITTTSEDAGGGASDETTYERASSLTLTPEGIGVYLRVTPMINEETGDIILVVNPKSSSTTRSLVASEEYYLDPEVRASKSVVRVKDGETIVLGGLIKHETEVYKRKFPVLGDVPVLGMLFRGKDQQKNIERELLVFITPHIVKDQAAPLSTRRGPKAPTGTNRQRSQANKVTLFTRHEAVNTALNNLDR